ncbi:hypothetical protein BDA96_10G223700 [Sorghum bicolor]|uniref:Uncharacterized protein n=1 Tax=Sorghum bicolor TaxID=4558 RepID=A0A921Q5M7_SORBI|nr:hypothetical protein BDA96_10G223700 [Sorghum bicolor]
MAHRAPPCAGAASFPLALFVLLPAHGVRRQPMLPILGVRQRGRCIQFNVRQGNSTLVTYVLIDLSQELPLNVLLMHLYGSLQGC